MRGGRSVRTCAGATRASADKRGGHSYCDTANTRLNSPWGKERSVGTPALRDPPNERFFAVLPNSANTVGRIPSRKTAISCPVTGPTCAGASCLIHHLARRLPYSHRECVRGCPIGVIAQPVQLHRNGPFGALRAVRRRQHLRHDVVPQAHIVRDTSRRIREPTLASGPRRHIRQIGTGIMVRKRKSEDAGIPAPMSGPAGAEPYSELMSASPAWSTRPGASWCARPAASSCRPIGRLAGESSNSSRTETRGPSTGKSCCSGWGATWPASMGAGSRRPVFTK